MKRDASRTPPRRKHEQGLADEDLETSPSMPLEMKSRLNGMIAIMAKFVTFASILGKLYLYLEFLVTALRPMI